MYGAGLSGKTLFIALQYFLLVSLFAQTGSANHDHDHKTPEPPQLSFLYTLYAECKPDLMRPDTGPRGIRAAIPIVGGNFTGPHLSGIDAHPYPHHDALDAFSLPQNACRHHWPLLTLKLR